MEWSKNKKLKPSGFYSYGWHILRLDLSYTCLPVAQLILFLKVRYAWKDGGWLSAQRTCSLISLKISYKSLQDFHYYRGSLVFTWLANWRHDWFWAAPITVGSNGDDSLSTYIRLSRAWVLNCEFLSTCCSVTFNDSYPEKEQHMSLRLSLVHVCWHGWNDILFCFSGWTVYSVPTHHKTPFCWTERNVAISGVISKNGSDHQLVEIALLPAF